MSTIQQEQAERARALLAVEVIDHLYGEGHPWFADIVRQPTNRAAWDLVLTKPISSGERVALEYINCRVWDGVEPTVQQTDVVARCDRQLAAKVLEAANLIARFDGALT